MADENKDNSDIYQLRDPSTLTEKVIAPPENSEFFAIKESVIGVTLGAGISLCNAYRLDKRLTSDESGETWQASDLQESRNVVVYLPPRDIRLDVAAMELTSHIARHLEALKHPRIVPFLDNFTDSEHGFFVVRKYINGKTLDVYRTEYIKRYKNFPPAKVLKILNDVALALDYAHHADVVHGAICPKNIIVGLDDEVNVANFALLPIQTFPVSAHQKYFAPEIAKGLTPTFLSDIYALAVVAYELFAGRLPVPTDAMGETSLPIPNVPSSVDTVIRKAMAKDPEDRFESCGSFVKELEKSFQGAPKVKSVLLTPTRVSSIKTLPAGLSYGIMLVIVLCVTGIAIWQTQPPFDGGKRQLAGGGKPEEVRLPAQPSNNGKRQTAEDGESRTMSHPVPVPSVLTEASPIASPEPTPQEFTPPEPTLLEPAPPEPTHSESTPSELTSPESTVPNPVQQEQSFEPTSLVSQESITISDEQDEDSIDTSSADLLREDGVQKSLSLYGVEYRFQWCKSESYLLGNGFWIQESPITQAMWIAAMKTHASLQPDEVNTRLPEVYVNWRDIEQFLEKVNLLEVLSEEEFFGRRFAVPTEKQWESITPHDKVLEWCNDWSEEVPNDRVVRGMEVQTRRDPLMRYENVGFRLVIVPKEPQLKEGQ